MGGKGGKIRFEPGDFAAEFVDRGRRPIPEVLRGVVAVEQGELLVRDVRYGW